MKFANLHKSCRKEQRHSDYNNHLNANRMRYLMIRFRPTVAHSRKLTGYAYANAHEVLDQIFNELVTH
jgi:hypothetical protein